MIKIRGLEKVGVDVTEVEIPQVAMGRGGCGHSGEEEGFPVGLEVIETDGLKLMDRVGEWLGEFDREGD